MSLVEAKIIETHNKKVIFQDHQKLVEVDVTYSMAEVEKREVIIFLFDDWKKHIERGCWYE